ncbi:MAG: 2-C-methyl-D-erythritol 2,4-cyclodiphosphate synthase [Candidatus Amulumruptor caecigallinarius]|nr:2-C-methyl-D-erythritol 2,4-cyclodiphosphate synthase [Candidatus Amulumruptor caecigallinarius]
MIRVGQGYDVHRLVAGRDLWICGVKIPYELGLDGHSDADVALHALCDALLGALALGDIGRHFPDTDPEYAGADSMNLLARVREMMEKRGYTTGNCDITIIAQRPKMLPYIERMRGNVAKVLGIDTDAVSVKATTTERLGFEGRGEGIAATAVALLRRI